MEPAADIQTERLVMRRPVAADAESIFESYASDPAVCRYLAWPAHRTVEDTRAFIEFSDSEWARGPVGPLLVHLRRSNELIGGTGLALEDGNRASTGYVFAASAWGNGFATETLVAICALARRLAVQRIHAFVHPEHLASRRVLEKAGFLRDTLLTRTFEFPNLAPGRRLDVLRYARSL